MDSCQLLYEYAYFVGRVRYYLEKYKGNLEYAVDCAVNECIEAKILEAFLIKHKAEVKGVILTEYDAKKHIKAEKSESYREGEAKFPALSLKLIDDGRIADLERAAKDEHLRQELYRQYGI